MITHPTLELGGQANAEAMKFGNENATPPVRARTSAEFTSFFDGLESVAPGVVPCSQWRPNDAEVGSTVDVPQLSAVARKR